MVSCVLERLESGAQRPTRTHRPHSSPSLALGGMLASLQLLVLPYGSVHGTSICTAHRVYSMRPCFESDRDYLYDLCFKASVSTSAPTGLSSRTLKGIQSITSCAIHLTESYSLYTLTSNMIIFFYSQHNFMLHLIFLYLLLSPNI